MKSTDKNQMLTSYSTEHETSALLHDSTLKHGASWSIVWFLYHRLDESVV